MKGPALALVVVLTACGDREPARSKPAAAAMALPAAAIQRGRDACEAYIAKVCACPSPAAAPQCALAKAMPEAMKLALDVAANPETARADALRAQTSVLETTKQCIERVARPCP